MKIVVIGGTGLIGAQLVRHLADQGHEAVAASPTSGVDTVTGDGLADVLQGAAVVVDASNPPGFADDEVLHFFESSTRNLLAAELRAGVRHHVALSVVGTQGLAGSGYFRAKIAQERLIKQSEQPSSIVQATQFFEFVPSIADGATVGGTVRLPVALIQPVASIDVVAAVAEVALGAPINGTTEIAGPQEFWFDELVRRGLPGDPREVVAEPRATYFGAALQERTLLPGAGAIFAATRLDDWLNQPTGSR